MEHVYGFVHVADIAEVHRLLLRHPPYNPNGNVFNVGSGRGHSVIDIYKAVLKQLNCEENFIFEEQREGDPPTLITNISKIKDILDWSPKFSSIQRIIDDAIKWSMISS